MVAAPADPAGMISLADPPAATDPGRVAVRPPAEPGVAVISANLPRALPPAADARGASSPPVDPGGVSSRALPPAGEPMAVMMMSVKKTAADAMWSGRGTVAV